MESVSERVQSTLDPREAVVATSGVGGGAVLVLRADDGTPADEVSLEHADPMEGVVRFLHADVSDDDLPDDEEPTTEMEFSEFRNARLAFGLWDRCGPFTEPEGSAVPRPIATDGQAAVTAWIYLQGGLPGETGTAAATAEIVGVATQTVRNRLTDIRWKPEAEA